MNWFLYCVANGVMAIVIVGMFEVGRMLLTDED